MIVWLIVMAIVLPFGFVLLFGAPYLPTRKLQARQALDLLGLKKDEVFVDLGCGDGAVLIEAAKRGLNCYGYELNPLVFMVCWLRTRRYRKNIKLYCRNFWQISLPPKTKGVFVFLLDKYMTQLDDKLKKELAKNTQLVSYTFQIPGRKPQKVVEALYLYEY